MAVAYGADAVYAGAAGFSMRPDKASFAKDEIASAVEYAHEKGKKFYAAINTLAFNEDLNNIRSWLEDTADIPFDALIISDAGVFDLVKEVRPETDIHISTQMSVANKGAASFWKKAGASRVILARECSLEQAADITCNSGIETEIFIHGAMCVAVSGRCLLSAHLSGKSGSRGDCKHSCRWEWQLVEQKRPGETIPVFETDRETIFLGSKDLCLIEHIPEVVKTGVSAVKIEGRMKGEYYIAVVTGIYRKALDKYLASPEDFHTDPEWLRELESVSHRPYGKGFAFGYPAERPETLQTSNLPISTAVPLGYVTETEGKRHLVSVRNPFVPGEEILWISPDGSSGSTFVEAVFNISGNPSGRALSSTEIFVEFSNCLTLPVHSVLRKKKENNNEKNSSDI